MAPNPRQLLQLYTEDGENSRERHATWLELFFDLVLVLTEVILPAKLTAY